MKQRRLSSRSARGDFHYFVFKRIVIIYGNLYFIFVVLELRIINFIYHLNLNHILLKLLKG